MNNRLIGMIMVLAFAGMATSMRGGSLNAPSAPTNAASAMWTLENIYNVLDICTTNVALRTGGFTEPMAEPTSGTMHTLNDIMALVTNRAPVPKSGQTSTLPFPAIVGSDGDLKIGVAWPTTRFVTNAVAAYSNCVTDNLTGLMWLKNPDVTTRDWPTAITYCYDLDGTSGRGTYTDWRLPNLRELQSLIDFGRYDPCLQSGHPFKNVQNLTYWSSTTCTNTIGNAYTLSMRFGQVLSATNTTLNYVWPVRGVQ